MTRSVTGPVTGSQGPIHRRPSQQPNQRPLSVMTQPATQSVTTRTPGGWSHYVPVGRLYLDSRASLQVRLYWDSQKSSARKSHPVLDPRRNRMARQAISASQQRTRCAPRQVSGATRGALRFSADLFAGRHRPGGPAGRPAGVRRAHTPKAVDHPRHWQWICASSLLQRRVGECSPPAVLDSCFRVPATTLTATRTTPGSNARESSWHDSCHDSRS